MEVEEAIRKLASTLDSVIVNFDYHLRDDHKMANHGYIEKGNDATLRFYLENCRNTVREVREAFMESE